MSLFIDIQMSKGQIENMISRASVAKKIKVKDLPKIKLDVYSMIALNNLVVFAVQFLQEHGVTATVEEVVSVCFRLFPQSFALKNYPRWPDSALVIRRLNDGREKGNIKDNSMDGFALKYRGQQLAKRVAKALGLVQPTPVQRKITPVKRENVPAQPVKVQSKRTRVVSQKKKVSAPVTRRKSPEKQLSKPASQTFKAKQETLPLIKMEEKSRKKAVKSPAPIPVKKASIRKKPRKQGSGKTTQLTLALPIVQEKKARPVVQTSKKKRKISPAQPERTVRADRVTAPITPSHVSKEEKAKAGKFVHSMERSDAYIHYKKSGKNSKIGEFDFRSLLLCTMESSRETLVKNIQLFKRYAGIHNHQDLLVFLEYCEDRFSYLLKPQNKPMRKLKK